MKPICQRMLGPVLISLLTVCLLLGSQQQSQASTCGYPNGPKAGTMVISANEYKSCSTLQGLTPPGYFGASLSGLPAGSMLANVSYGGYCVDLTGNLLDNQLLNVVYTADFWSSLDPNLPSAVKQVTDSQTSTTYTIPWDKINYILNKYPNESWLNLQGAYWDLVHGCTQLPGSLYTCGTLRPAPYYFPLGTSYSSTNSYGCQSSDPPLVDETRVQYLVNDANNNGNGFVPKAGERIASVGQITNCTPSATCNQYLPYQVIFIPTTCPTCTGTVGDRVWKDLNGNGIQDKNAQGEYTEPGIPNVKVTLSGTDAYGQSVSITKVTDANGNYLFTELCASQQGTQYTVTVDETTLPVDVIRTDPRSNNGDDNNPNDSNEPTGTTVTINTDNGSNLTIDFGYEPLCTGTVGNQVWKDIPNGNGMYDAGEPGISGVQLSLTGTDVYNKPVNLLATTNAIGDYSFKGLCQGTYTVKVDSGIPAGFVLTTNTPSSNGNDGVDNDSNNPTNTIVTLFTDKENNQTLDFGYVPKCAGSIGDFVWKDLNENGIQESGEPGIDGVRVHLSGTNNYGQLVSMYEITQNGGKYIFHGVCQNAPNKPYTVTIDPTSLPGGYFATSPRSTDGSDSNGTDSNEPKGTMVPCLTTVRSMILSISAITPALVLSATLSGTTTTATVCRMTALSAA